MNLLRTNASFFTPSRSTATPCPQVGQALSHAGCCALFWQSPSRQAAKSIEPALIGQIGTGVGLGTRAVIHTRDSAANKSGWFQRASRSVASGSTVGDTVLRVPASGTDGTVGNNHRWQSWYTCAQPAQHWHWGFGKRDWNKKQIRRPFSRICDPRYPLGNGRWPGCPVVQDSAREHHSGKTAR